MAQDGGTILGLYAQVSDRGLSEPDGGADALPTALREEALTSDRPRNRRGSPNPVIRRGAGRVTWGVEREDVVVAGGIAAIAAVALWHGRHGTFDDAFIFFRYAANLVHGHGWTYNPGQHTADAATSPLYLLVLTAMTFVVRDAALAGALIFAASLWTVGWLLYRLFSGSTNRTVAVCVAVAVMANPLLLDERGLETMPFLAGVVASVLLFVRRRPVLLGLALGLTVLTRGDGALLAVIIVAVLTWERKALPLSTITAGLGVAMGWTAVALAVGAPILPDTFGAKTAQAVSGFFPHGGYLSSASFFVAQLGLAHWLALALIGAVAGAAATALHRRLLNAVLPFIAFAVLLFIAYGWVIRPVGFPWYFAPQALALSILGGVGVGWLLSTATARPRRLLALAALVLLASTCSIGLRDVWTSQPKDRSSYPAAAAWLRTHSPSDATVAASEIGIVGYDSNRPIVDYLGLLDRRSIDDLRRHDLTSWLTRDNPAFVIVHRPAWSMEIPYLSTPAFARYRQVWATPTLAIFSR